MDARPTLSSPPVPPDCTDPVILPQQVWTRLASHHQHSFLQTLVLVCQEILAQMAHEREVSHD